MSEPTVMKKLKLVKPRLVKPKPQPDITWNPSPYVIKWEVKK